MNLPRYYPGVLLNVSFGFISLILRDFSLSSRAFYLGNGHLTIPCGKKTQEFKRNFL